MVLKGNRVVEFFRHLMVYAPQDERQKRTQVAMAGRITATRRFKRDRPVSGEEEEFKTAPSAQANGVIMGTNTVEVDPVTQPDSSTFLLSSIRKYVFEEQSAFVSWDLLHGV